MTLVRALKVAEDIVPIAKVKAHLAETVRRVKATGRPVVITQNGVPAAGLLAPADYDEEADRARFVASVQRGLADVAAGRSYSEAEVDSAIDRRLAERRRR